ncbi:hypothetical protein DPX16_20830 [Anabarilius grahami]|uniref:Immunoglobulin domain-containing protein n=1 Tax=Anabarilius grahami TaxID=495550 RepID=A0A3N0ZB28_ANAGA|nr:hypothetical protein DPX16_20830 [Anabarilius grahami]
MKTLLLSLLCVFVWSQHTEGFTDQQVTLGQSVTVTYLTQEDSEGSGSGSGLDSVLLLVCQTTESLTDKQVNLGQNVTLDCQIDVKDVYWVFQKLTDSPVLILRTFSSGFTSSVIQDERFKDKYSSLTLSRLCISNITIDKLGIYYCVKKTVSGLKLSNGTRLYITEAARDQNHTEVNNNSQCPNTPQALIVLYAILSIVIFLAIIVLLVCQTTESLTDKQVNLGQNVTLDCQIDVSDVYWVFQKLTDSPVLILRTFLSGFTSSLIQDERFKDKYSSLTLSHLFISNITIDKLGIYYCVKTTVSGLRLSNGTRLYITVLLIFKLKKPTKSRQHRQNVEPEQLEDFNAAQYSEIELPTYSREENPKRINGTYVLLQKPKPHQRVQHNMNLQSC